MSNLSNPPIIEAIFELHWGRRTVIPPNHINFEFDANELAMLPGQFQRAVEEEGFSHLETLNPNSTGLVLPHQPHYRFRKAEGQWPCFQLGAGLFTTNQVQEGYSWEGFEKTIKQGLYTLNKAYPGGLSKLPILAAQLTYIDGLILPKGGGFLDFLQANLNVNFHVDKQIYQHKSLSGRASQHSLSFNVEMDSPKGTLSISMQESLISGQPGIVVNILTLSDGDNVPKPTMISLLEWVTKAHQVQSEAFEKLLKTEYLETLR